MSTRTIFLGKMVKTLQSLPIITKWKKMSASRVGLEARATCHWTGHVRSCALPHSRVALPSLVVVPNATPTACEVLLSTC
jgi:hypothetical protein